MDGTTGIPAHAVKLVSVVEQCATRKAPGLSSNPVWLLGIHLTSLTLYFPIRNDCAKALLTLLDYSRYQGERERV